MMFEPNQGQADAVVKFLARGRGYEVFLTGTDAVVRLRRAGSKMTREDMDPTGTSNRQAATRAERSAVLRMKLVGANPPAAIKGIEELSGVSNYVRGKDPSRWVLGVPQFSAVRYDDVYPGIAQAFYGTDHQLEYDFIVSPGSDPSAIGIGFEGARRLSLNPHGDLLLDTAAGIITQQKPFIYQEVAGERREVDGGYVVAGMLVGIRVGDYEPSLPLIIDPVLGYSTFLGGCCGDAGAGIAVDSRGNTYVTGETGSPDFPATAGAAQKSLRGSTDVFVTKLNPSGSAVIYSTYLGGVAFDSGAAIAIDAAGNTYVTGRTESPDFPVTPGAAQTTSGGGADAFVAKLNPAGGALVYATFLGGEALDAATSVALDSSNNAYLTGLTTSISFPVTTGALQESCKGRADAFVAKLDQAGARFLYSTYLGGPGSNEGNGIAVDSAGNAYVAGSTTSLEFATTAGALQTSIGGAADAFVTKLNPAGAALVYSTYVGGTNDDMANGIALDSAGNAYVAGETTSSDFATTAGSFQTILRGPRDGFVVKLSAAGSSRVYSTLVGGEGFDVIKAIAFDGGGVYLTGSTNSFALPTGPGAAQPALGGRDDAFAARLDASGTALTYSTYIGGPETDEGRAIATDSVGNAYVTGITVSASFPTTVGAAQGSFGGGSDGFVVKIAATADLSLSSRILPAELQTGSTATISLTLLNSGPAPADDVVVKDTLPEGVMFVSCSATGSGVCGGSASMRTVSFSSLAAGRSEVISLVVELDCSLAGAMLTNLAEITTTTPESDATNNLAAVTLMPMAGPPSLGIDKTTLDFGEVNPTSRGVRSQAVGTFTIRNEGCSRLTVNSVEIRRVATREEKGNIIITSGSEFFSIDAPNAGIERAEPRTFTVRFNPVLPDAVIPQPLPANQVLPQNLKSILTVFHDGVKKDVEVTLTGSVPTAVRLMNIPAGAPAVALVRDGDKVFATFTLYDANLDLDRVHFEFLTSDGRVLTPTPPDVSLREHMVSEHILPGQAFRVIQQFKGARRHRSISRIRITVFDGEGKVIGLSSPVGTASANSAGQLNARDQSPLVSLPEISLKTRKEKNR
ncbi:MAG TPA: SBBP repeat-containing protein [Blastocatellia bacterium]|nr:SBBP repeat-containing protein [Blastocatellia bacterium]